jgi:hypothetical protein
MNSKNPKGPTVEPTMGMAPMDQQEIPIEEGCDSPKMHLELRPTFPHR